MRGILENACGVILYCVVNILQFLGLPIGRVINSRGVVRIFALFYWFTFPFWVFSVAIKTWHKVEWLRPSILLSGRYGDFLSEGIWISTGGILTSLVLFFVFRYSYVNKIPRIVGLIMVFMYFSTLILQITLSHKDASKNLHCQSCP